MRSVKTVILLTEAAITKLTFLGQNANKIYRTIIVSLFIQAPDYQSIDELVRMISTNDDRTFLASI